MTSTASSSNKQAPTSSAATSVPSYASAAGASKKPASSASSATGSDPTPVVVGGSSAQHAKPAGSSSLNGRPAVTPAVPTPSVAHGSNNLNGNAAEHIRKSSVTMSANGPNSYAAAGAAAGPGGSKSGIQFGFKDSSPAVAHSTPQMAAAPIPIPGGNQSQRVPSPAHSPSPIPQPSASGGRPPSGIAQQNTQMTFGSLGSEGDRHMRQGSAPQNPAALSSQPGAHIRRESAVSQHSDAGVNRPSFTPQAGRGRGGPGFNPQHPPFNGNNMGYPPNYPRPNNAGRGAPNMPPAFQPGRPMGAYPNSPGPGRSPALAHAQPGHSQPGTPNMHHAQMHPMPMQTPPQFHYAAPHNMPPQQVQPPPFLNSFPRSSKKKLGRRGSDKFYNESHRSREYSNDLDYSHTNKFRRSNRRDDSSCDDSRWSRPLQHMPPQGARPFESKQPARPFEPRIVLASQALPSAARQFPLQSSLPRPPHLPHDLSPESGNFERLLTNQKQFGYPPYGQFDPRGPGFMPQPYMGQGPAGSPATNFQQAYVPPPYHTPAPQSMSRTSSHSERPSSSTGQPNQSPVVVSGSQPQNSQKGGLQGSFRPPKKSAAILIKNPQGETMDFSTMKAPASPSPSIQQSKTPPVVASTPPPKTGFPTHNRNESQSTPKTAKEIQEELRAKIMKAAAGGDDKEKEKPKEETAKPQTPAQPEQKSTETKPAAEPVVEKKEDSEIPETSNKPEPKVEEAKPEAKPEAKSEVKPEAKSEVKSEEKAEEKAEAPAQPAAEDEEDEIERQIREMEEAEAKREAEAAEYEAKKKARLEEEKKNAAANKATSAADEDKKLREAEREAERLEEEKEKKRAAAEAGGSSAPSVAEILAGAKSGEPKEIDSKVSDVTDKLSNLNIEKDGKTTPTERRGAKPAALNLAPINTKPVEPPQPSAALQSLKSARFLTIMKPNMYPEGIASPNPALNAAVAKKGKTFKYDAQFLLQFQKVFTEQPSLEFHQQVKSLIGENDGRSTPRPGNSRQPSRTGSFAPAPASSTMGSFSSARGTTSAERFARANAGIVNNGPPAVGGMGSFGRNSSFPMGAPMSRNPSTANMGAPNSPRTNSRRGAGSKRGGEGAREAQAAKTMPLTAGQDLKPITTSSTGWKPMSVVNKSAAAAPTGHLDPETVQRKVKAALNKMTPEKFDKIADQILEIAAQSKNESDGRTLRQVIQLTFEKATDEAHWASMYAKFCKRMLDTMSTDIRDETLVDKNGEVVSGGALFRKYLLNRCQEEFERGWKTNLEKPTEEDTKDKTQAEATMLSDEYYLAAAAKRRGLGLVQFIGELYKLGMLTERIMHACVKKLVDYETMPEEAEIESLCKLLRTIGGNLDASPRGKGVMDAYFDRIQGVVNMPELNSRLKFMLMDIIDLRKANWATKEANKGPKTLEEVRAEAEAAAAAKAQENARSGSQRGPGGRPGAGRGDARAFSNYGQQNSNQVGMDDLRRLKSTTGRAASGGMTLGPTSMFSSRSNSGRRLGPGGALGRGGEDSGASSRTGTPPTTHTNAFSALANLDSGENPASPPSTAASPALSKAVPDSSAASESK